MENINKNQRPSIPQNFLKAVFWDNAKLCDPETVGRLIKKAKSENDIKMLRWIMARFLEHGRVKDTAVFFSPKEIKDTLRFLKISSRARKRWERLVEVYGNID